MTPEAQDELKQDVEDLVVHILEAVVQVPEEIKVQTQFPSSNFLMVKAKVRESDAGLAVGRKGCVIFAIRSILECVAGRYKISIRYDLENQEKHSQRVS